MMTNKQTIDGVSRELLELSAAKLSNMGQSHISNPLYDVLNKHTEELRALLDRPAGWSPCSPKLLESGVDCATAPRWSSKEWDGHSHWHPEPAAQPQGEVERLRIDLELTQLARQSDQIEIDGLKALNDGLRDQRDGLNALLREVAYKCNVGFAMRERLLAALSTSAEPKPRGEAVVKAKPVAKLHAERLSGRDGEYGIAVEDSTWLNTCRLTGGVFKLYAEPTHSGDANEMVAKVVLPERKKYVHQGLSHTDAKADGWNDCLDEVAKLNGLKP